MKKIFVIGSYLNYLDYWLKDFQIVKSPEEAEIILFAGGTDVNPEMYGEKRGKYTQYPSTQRDQKETEIFNKFPNTLKIGICRGSQLLTVLSGGKLIQHVTNHEMGLQTMETNDGTYQITTDHHQMMYPFNLKSDEYEIIGWCKPSVSLTYWNGDNKNIDLPHNFKECETVYYNKTNSLCIQSHPEYSFCPKETMDYFNNLVNYYYNIIYQNAI